MTALSSTLPSGPQSGMGEGPEVSHGHAQPRRGGNGLILEGFAGPGGWSEGLRALGRQGPVVGVELDRDACLTATAAGHVRVRADVATFPIAHLRGRVDGVILSPPCQSFSNAGQRLGQLDQPAIYAHLDRVTAAGRWVEPDAGGWHDPRSPLVLEPLRWVDQLRPRWVALEQVPPVLPLWEAYAKWLRGLGYSAAVGLLSAECFGVPQTRLRAFLAARNDGVPARLPTPTHQRYVPSRRADEPAADGLFDEPARERAVHPADRGLLPWVSMADALGWAADRPARTMCGDRSPRWAYGPGPSSYATGWTLETEQRSETAAGRVPIVRDHDEPAPTLVANADRWEIQSSSRAKVNDRTRWQYRNGNQDHAAIRDQDQPAPTVHFAARSNKVDWVAGDNESVRVSVRQAAVLQGFAPDHPWQGTKTSQFSQVGNCVCPPVSAAVLGELLDTGWRARLWGDQ